MTAVIFCDERFRLKSLGRSKKMIISSSECSGNTVTGTCYSTNISTKINVDKNAVFLKISSNRTFCMNLSWHYMAPRSIWIIWNTWSSFYLHFHIGIFRLFWLIRFSHRKIIFLFRIYEDQNWSDFCKLLISEYNCIFSCNPLREVQMLYHYKKLSSNQIEIGFYKIGLPKKFVYYYGSLGHCTLPVETNTPALCSWT